MPLFRRDLSRSDPNPNCDTNSSTGSRWPIGYPSSRGGSSFHRLVLLPLVPSTSVRRRHVASPVALMLPSLFLIDAAECELSPRSDMSIDDLRYTLGMRSVFPQRLIFWNNRIKIVAGRSVIAPYSNQWRRCSSCLLAGNVSRRRFASATRILRPAPILVA